MLVKVEAVPLTQTLRLKGGIGADAPFWDALDDGAFRLPQCSGCGRWTWPAHFRCGECGSWNFEWIAVSPHGQVYTWTRNHAASDVVRERRAMLPYVSLLVELPEAGCVRIAGVLAGSDSGLRIGAPVRGEIRPADAISKGYATMVWRLTEGASA